MSDSFNGIALNKARLAAAAVIFAAAAMSGCSLYENSGEDVFAEPVLPSAAAEHTSSVTSSENTDSPWEGEYSRTFSLPEPVRRTDTDPGTKSPGYDSDTRTVSKGDAASKQGDAEDVLPEPAETAVSAEALSETVTTALSVTAAVEETTVPSLYADESSAEKEFTFTLPEAYTSVTAAPAAVSEQTDYDKDFFSGDLFIGDSISTGYSLYGFLDDRNVYAKVGLNPSTVLTKSVSTCYGEIGISSMLSFTAPGRVYIMLGSNGIQWLSVGNMLQSTDTLVKLIKECCPGAEAAIISVPPVTAAYDASVEDVNVMEKINEYNASLSSYCEANGMLFVDAASLLKDETGYFNGSYAESDGMHFKSSAYKTLLSKIQKDVSEFESAAAAAALEEAAQTAVPETSVPETTISETDMPETEAPPETSAETKTSGTWQNAGETEDIYVTAPATEEETAPVSKKKPALNR